MPFKRICCFIASAVFCLQFLFAGGVMAGENGRRVIKTDYFDIIYPRRSSETAVLVASHIDGMYKSICTEMGEDTQLHLPVVITPVHDSLNAYYTAVPYNRIVIYDTVPDEQLAVYSEHILSVLYHELVHAVMINMKSGGLRHAGHIFGDFLTGEVLTAPSSVTEGAAVAFESSSGEGRLNSSYSTRILKQAKLEGCFPSWQNSTGARDVYPSGELPYIFGGAFTAYLQNTYGMEKYHDFWYRLVNGFSLYPAVFKKVYGISMDTAWEQFRESVKVPDIPSDPAAGGSCFKIAEKDGGGETGRRISVTSYIHGTDKGFAWIESGTQSVWYVPFTGDVQQRAVKLFTLTGISRCSFSADGQYLTVSYSRNDRAVHRYAGIFSMKKKRLYRIPESGLRDACTVLGTDGMVYAAAVKTESQHASIVLYAVKEKKGSLSFDKKPYSSIAFETGTVPFSLSDAGNGRIAFIYKAGMQWTLRVYDTVSGVQTGYLLPYDHLEIQNAAVLRGNGFKGRQQGLLIAFSWAAQDMLPRAGFLAVKYAADGTGQSAVWYLQNSDISGGIQSPCVYPGTSGVRLPDILYSARFYRSGALYVLKSDAAAFDSLPAQMDTAAEQRTMITADAEKKRDDSGSVPYAPFGWYARGIFAPLGLVQLYDADLDAQATAYLGATWITADPWGGTVFAFSGGYEPYSNKYGLMAQVSGGLDTAFFKYAAQGTALFDKEGFFQTFDALTASSTVSAGMHSAFVFSNTGSVFNGKSFNTKCSESRYADEDLFYMHDIVSAEYTTVHKTGEGTYEKAGIFLGPFLTCSYKSSRTYAKEDTYINAGGMAGFCVPRLLPFENPADYTVNIPATTAVSLFPAEKYFMSGTQSFILFSKEIQKGTAHFPVPLYANRLTCSAVYSDRLKYDDAQSWDIVRVSSIAASSGQLHYYDSISLGANIFFKLNTGVFASLVTFNCGTAIIYALHKEPDKSAVSIKFTGVLVF